MSKIPPGPKFEIAGKSELNIKIVSMIRLVERDALLLYPSLAHSILLHLASNFHLFGMAADNKMMKTSLVR